VLADRELPRSGTYATVDSASIHGVTLGLMERFARQDVLAVLARFGIDGVRRAIPIDPTEEVFLVSSDDFARIDSRAVCLALMDVLPHTKVLVAPNGQCWRSEPI
jgi:hypothetical protein